MGKGTRASLTSIKQQNMGSLRYTLLLSPLIQLSTVPGHPVSRGVLGQPLSVCVYVCARVCLSKRTVKRDKELAGSGMKKENPCARGGTDRCQDRDQAIPQSALSPIIFTRNGMKSSVLRTSLVRRKVHVRVKVRVYHQPHVTSEEGDGQQL